MYFSVTPDDVISIFEVRSVLHACFIVLNKLHLFEKYLQEFENLMPECLVYRNPRKLAHLAGCQIRENLKVSKFPLPAAIEKLDLPKRLKNFIACDVNKC